MTLEQLENGTFKLGERGEILIGKDENVLTSQMVREALYGSKAPKHIILDIAKDGGLRVSQRRVKVSTGEVTYSNMAYFG